MEHLDPGTLADINSIAQRLGMSHWDVILIGDGAGRSWDKPAGWSCILIDRHAGVDAQSDGRKLFSGGLNLGTIDIAELMPYIQAMLWYDQFWGKRRRREQAKELLDVLIITDRKSIADQGLALQSGLARASDLCRRHPLWTVMVQLERHGYRFTWVWQERNKVALNAVADRMADAAKHAAANALAQARAHIRSDLPGSPSEEDLIYHFNAAALGTNGATKLVRRRRYIKTPTEDGTGV